MGYEERLQSARNDALRRAHETRSKMKNLPGCALEENEALVIATLYAAELIAFEIWCTYD